MSVRVIQVVRPKHGMAAQCVPLKPGQHSICTKCNIYYTFPNLGDGKQWFHHLQSGLFKDEDLFFKEFKQPELAKGNVDLLAVPRNDPILGNLLVIMSCSVTFV